MNKINMLLLDDDETLRFNLQLFFEDEGINVIPANCGEDAIELVRNNKFDIAIVDIRLPGINGEEFIQKSRDLDNNLAFIIHTGSARYKVPKEIKKLGVSQSQVLQKPVEDMQKFVAKIYSVIKKNSRR
jgi:two-component system, OmpR family, response regulator